MDATSVPWIATMLRAASATVVTRVLGVMACRLPIRARRCWLLMDGRTVTTRA